MPIIKDPKMNKFIEDRYGILEMEDGRFVAYDKKNDLKTRYLPWGWNFTVSETETSTEAYTTYQGEEIKEKATNYNFHGQQGIVIRRIQKFICEDPKPVFDGVKNEVGEDHAPQDPPAVAP